MKRDMYLIRLLLLETQSEHLPPSTPSPPHQTLEKLLV